MRQMLVPGTALVGALVLVASLGQGAPAPMQPAVTGRVVWDGGAIPKRVEIEVNQNKAHCTSKGPLYSDALVINPKNKGVSWAVAWLVDAKGPRKVLPMPPALRKVLPAKVEIDQPCCAFEPHIVVLREGQSLVLKNSSPIPHNTNLLGGPLGPHIGPIVPPGRHAEIEASLLKPRLLPILISCNIHAWMKGFIFVSNSPYIAVSDADGNFTITHVPDGKYKLIV